MPRHTSSSLRLRLAVPIILSLIGGLWILIGAIPTASEMHWMGWYGPWMHQHVAWMDWSGMMSRQGGQAPPGWFAIGVITAALVLLGAAMAIARPRRASAWSLLIIIGAVLSFLLGFGAVTAPVLCLIGGILALIVSTGVPRISTTGNSTGSGGTR
jgi:hypothetical protein